MPKIACRRLPGERPSIARAGNRGGDAIPKRNALRNGGAGGIRTLDTAFQPYNGLANRRLQPLGHSTAFIFSLRDEAEGIIGGPRRGRAGLFLLPAYAGGAATAPMWRLLHQIMAGLKLAEKG